MPLDSITKVDSSPDGKNVKVFFTVFPENQEEAALDFAKRKRSDFREFVKDKSRLSTMPFFDFEIDRGEKARQKIDALPL
jgi:ribosome-binding factor A